MAARQGTTQTGSLRKRCAGKATSQELSSTPPKLNVPGPVDVLWRRQNRCPSSWGLVPCSIAQSEPGTLRRCLFLPASARQRQDHRRAPGRIAFSPPRTRLRDERTEAPGTPEPNHSTLSPSGERDAARGAEYPRAPSDRVQDRQSAAKLWAESSRTLLET